MIIRNDASVKQTRLEMKGIQDELKGLAQVITRQAVQEERLTEQSRRMNFLEQRIEDLRRGVGWVQTRETVDGEYPGR